MRRIALERTGFKTATREGGGLLLIFRRRYSRKRESRSVTPLWSYAPSNYLQDRLYQLIHRMNEESTFNKVFILLLQLRLTILLVSHDTQFLHFLHTIHKECIPIRIVKETNILIQIVKEIIVEGQDKCKQINKSPRFIRILIQFCMPISKSDTLWSISRIIPTWRAADISISSLHGMRLFGPSNKTFK